MARGTCSSPFLCAFRLDFIYTYRLGFVSDPVVLAASGRFVWVCRERMCDAKTASRSVVDSRNHGPGLTTNRTRPRRAQTLNDRSRGSITKNPPLPDSSRPTRAYRKHSIYYYNVCTRAGGPLPINRFLLFICLFVFSFFYYYYPPPPAHSIARQGCGRRDADRVPPTRQPPAEEVPRRFSSARDSNSPPTRRTTTRANT